MNPNERHPERVDCVITASEVPEACGIGYGSRGAWARGEKRVEDEVQKRRLENGQHGEHAAAVTYREHCCNVYEELLPEFFSWVDTVLGKIGATPDGVVRIAGIGTALRLVEYKCIDGCGEDRLLAPLRANHVLQLATQLYVCGFDVGHLFYYRSSGEYVCYSVKINSPAHYEQIVFPWLKEAFAMKDHTAPLENFPRGEAQRRRETVVREFLIV